MIQRVRTASGATPFISAIVAELALVTRRPGASLWVAPAAVSAVSTGGAVFAYRETLRPIPAPPDSMQSHYGLTDERMWRSYGDGFREEIDERRRAELARTSRSALLTAIMFAGTYAALQRR